MTNAAAVVLIAAGLVVTVWLLVRLGNENMRRRGQ